MSDTIVVDELVFEDATTSCTSSPINTSKARTFTVHYLGESVSSGATILIQGSLDNTNWVTLDTESIATNGITEYTSSDKKYKFIRGNISSYTDGTYNVRILAGN